MDYSYGLTFLLAYVIDEGCLFCIPNSQERTDLDGRGIKGSADNPYPR